MIPDQTQQTQQPRMRPRYRAKNQPNSATQPLTAPQPQQPQSVPQPAQPASASAPPQNTVQQAQSNFALRPMALPQSPPQATGVSLTRTNPNNDLRGQTITPSIATDRTALANQYIQNWNAASKPAFDADVRDTINQGAALGQLGSGGLRTRVGNLVANRDAQRDIAQSNFLTDALNNSINDAYNNIGIAQQQQAYQTGLADTAFNQGLAREQQNNATQAQQFGQGVTTAQLENAQQNQLFGQNVTTQQLEDARQQQAFNQALASGNFQNALQGQLFNQGITSQQLEDSRQQQQFNQALQSAGLQNSQNAQEFGQQYSLAQLMAQLQGQQFGQAQSQSQIEDQLTNSSFNRSLQQLLAGNSNNPADTSLILSQIFGNQASAASGALGGLINNVVGRNSAQNQQSQIMQLLQQLGINPIASTPTTPSSAIPTNEPWLQPDYNGAASGVDSLLNGLNTDFIRRPGLINTTVADPNGPNPWEIYY